jgi:hypothetical protein
MPVQDDARENQMVWMFNLSVPPDRGRSDVDAFLEMDGQPEPIPFELKSATGNSVSTVRDFGPEHIAKWRHVHWLFAFYERGGKVLRHCYYASPADMADWIAGKEEYVRPDYVLAQRAAGNLTDSDLTEVPGDAADFSGADARRIMKNQWNADQYANSADRAGGRYSRAAMLKVLQNRCEYVIRRGATLNNPHIPESYLSDRVQPITKDHAATVRELVGRYLTQRDVQIIAGQAPSASATDDASA